MKERIAMLRKAIDMTVVYKGQGREMWESGYDGSGHDSSSQWRERIAWRGQERQLIAERTGNNLSSYRKTKEGENNCAQDGIGQDNFAQGQGRKG